MIYNPEENIKKFSLFHLERETIKYIVIPWPRMLKIKNT